MNLLARREHSRSELVRKLRRRFELDELEAALTQLAADNLQSDERFALSYTRERMLRGYGPLRIVAELRHRGITRAQADDAVRRVPKDENLNWRALAAAALTRKFGASPPVDLEEKARRLRFLSYRGFAEESAGIVDDGFC